MKLWTDCNDLMKTPATPYTIQPISDNLKLMNWFMHNCKSDRTYHLRVSQPKYIQVFWTNSRYKSQHSLGLFTDFLKFCIKNKKNDNALNRVDLFPDLL